MKKLSKKAVYMGAVVLSFGAASSVTLFDKAHVNAAVPYVNQLISVDSSGVQQNGYVPSSGAVSISKDGRYVAFSSTASNLVVGDTNAKNDIFVRDTANGTTVRASVSTSGAQTTSSILVSKISANGRYVVFGTSAANMVAGDTNAKSDIFVRDLQTNTTEMVSVSTSGDLGNDHVDSVFDISADGRYVAFASSATNLVSSDTNGAVDVFVRDRKLNTTTLLSKSDSGVLGNDASSKPSISCDGAFVSFKSYASNLSSGDTNLVSDVFLVNRIGGNSVANVTPASNGDVYDQPVLSCDGSTVVYRSTASNLVADDTNARADIFAYSVSSGATERVSVSSASAQANGQSEQSYSLSNDGRYVAFTSGATNLVSDDTNNYIDAFLRDRQAGTTERVSMRSTLAQTDHSSYKPAISADGKHIAFINGDNSIVSGDTNGGEDVFLSETGISACAI